MSLPCWYNKNYSLKVCVYSFDHYSARYKVYIRLSCINTQQTTTSSFDITNVISSIKCQLLRLYQGSANCCEGHSISDIIRLLQPYQKIRYCNQSMLVIVPDLNIFFWSITIKGITSRRSLEQFFYITC